MSVARAATWKQSASGRQVKRIIMTDEAFLRSSLASLDVNDTFSDAVLVMRDQSRLRFCHRVGERWAKAEGSPNGQEGQAGLAAEILPTIAMFRLNAKHLDVQFNDASRWEARFRDRS
jgi:hypothetical protein